MRSSRTVALACWAVLTGMTVLATPPVNAAAAAPTVSVSGNHLVDSNGNVVQLRGVNRSGAEYACAEGWGIWDGPTDDDASIASMLTWKVNAVRIPLNEDCWLAINGINSQYSGTTYINAVVDYVNRLNAHGIVAIPNLHFSAPGTTVPDAQVPMADREHSNAFWTSVANTFKNNHSVLFDLFNEPYPDNNQDTTAAWTCNLNGGTCPGVSFTAAGMQEMVNAVRATGATQPLLIGGPQYAGVVDHWTQYKPSDPLNQLVASIHIYGLPLDSPCRLQTCWNATVAPLAATTPVVIGELGDTDCTSNFSPGLMTWADAHGVSYTPWAWNVANCAADPSLISTYTGTPTAYGVGVQTHLLAVSSTPTPPPVIPEVPLALLLPLVAVAIFGAATLIRRRRRSRPRSDVS
ncbi:MAG: glycoside hydrolase family 5 protein [Chloroflexota bacterium]|nr:MAG: glycoside hydrolase family 5 protein [Chloroflexota bacterium]